MCRFPWLSCKQGSWSGQVPSSTWGAKAGSGLVSMPRPTEVPKCQFSFKKFQVQRVLAALRQVTLVETTGTAHAQVGADLPVGRQAFCLANLGHSVKYRGCRNIHLTPGLKYNGCNQKTRYIEVQLESPRVYARQKQKLHLATGHLPATHLLLLTAVDLDSNS